MNQNHEPPPPQQSINRVYESLLDKTNCKEDSQTSSAAWEKQKEADMHRGNKDEYRCLERFRATEPIGKDALQPIELQTSLTFFSGFQVTESLGDAADFESFLHLSVTPHQYY